MNVNWGDMQSGRFEVLLDGRFIEDGAVVEACTEKGMVKIIPTDPATGALLFDQEKGDWLTRVREGEVRIFEWPRFLVPS